MPYLYHYTDAAGYHGINRSGRIMKSNGQGDAAYGRGVYLTSLPPTTNPNVLVRNNWGDGFAGARHLVEYYFQFHYDDLPSVDRVGDWQGRDVWLYRGHINLDQLGYKQGSCKHWPY